MVVEQIIAIEKKKEKNIEKFKRLLRYYNANIFGNFLQHVTKYLFDLNFKNSIMICWKNRKIIRKCYKKKNSFFFFLFIQNI